MNDTTTTAAGTIEEYLADGIWALISLTIEDLREDLYTAGFSAPAIETLLSDPAFIAEWEAMKEED